MAGARFRFLLDEDTSLSLADRLEEEGHDTRRVVDVDELGTGAPDPEVRALAARDDRILITHDTDHIEPEAPPRVFLIPSQRLDGETVVRAIDGVAASVDAHEELPAVVYLTPEWI